MFGFEGLDQQMHRLEQFLVYSDDSRREIETVNLLVARNTPVTFARPVSAVISELQPDQEPVPPSDASKSFSNEPEIRKAVPVHPAGQKALPYSPDVKKYHASPTPLPVRKAIPIQRFNQENKPHG